MFHAFKGKNTTIWIAIGLFQLLRVDSVSRKMNLVYAHMSAP